MTIRGLSDGYHLFAARAVAEGAEDSTPATHLFRVRKTGEECYKALAALDWAEGRVEHALYGLSIHEDKIEKLKHALLTAAGRYRDRLRQRMREQRVARRQARQWLREQSSALEVARERRDAACGA